MTNLCQQCGTRPALAARGSHSHSHKRGRRLARGDHDMCRQCWNSNKESTMPRPARGRLDGVLDDLLEAAKRVA